MTVRIKKLSILQTGKVLGLIFCFYSAVIIPVFLVELIGKPQFDFPLLLMIISYPVMGFMGGIIFAFLYNLVSRYIGGFELTMEITQEQNLIK